MVYFNFPAECLSMNTPAFVHMQADWEDDDVTEQDFQERLKAQLGQDKAMKE